MENISYITVRPKIAAQILLIMSGVVETCPGPDRNEVKQDYDRILTKKGLKLCHLNVRGLWINLANITQILTDFKKIDILSLGETHIRDEPGEMFKMDGFTFLSRPRSN